MAEDAVFRCRRVEACRYCCRESVESLLAAEAGPVDREAQVVALAVEADAVALAVKGSFNRHRRRSIRMEHLRSQMSFRVRTT